MKALGQEDFVDDYKIGRKAYHIPNCLKPIISSLLQFTGNKRKSFYTKMIGVGDIKKYNDAIFEKLKLVQMFEELFEILNLDAIISPVFACAPIKHGEFKDINMCTFYSGLFNLVDHPSAVIPRVHIVNKDDTNPNLYNDLKYGDDSITQGIRKSMIGSEGLPIGIQISTLTHQDER